MLRNKLKQLSRRKLNDATTRFLVRSVAVDESCEVFAHAERCQHARARATCALTHQQIAAKLQRAAVDSLLEPPNKYTNSNKTSSMPLARCGLLILLHRDDLYYSYLKAHCVVQHVLNYRSKIVSEKSRIVSLSKIDYTCDD